MTKTINYLQKGNFTPSGDRLRKEFFEDLQTEITRVATIAEESAIYIEYNINIVLKLRELPQP